MLVPPKTYFQKTIGRLYGIIEGVSIDYKINDTEIAELKRWIDTHEDLHPYEPFKGLISLLDDILEDEVIDREERAELLEWCADTINERGFMDCLTEVVRQLHGICSGIECDRKITEEEMRGLEDWLLDYEHLKNWWPINEMFALIKKVLADGVIDQEEEARIKEFFTDFKEQIIENPQIHDDFSFDSRFGDPKIFKSISSICEKEPEIIFEDRRFCFTGPAATGNRREMNEI